METTATTGKPKPQPVPKTATITLRASGVTMRMHASRRSDGTAVTFVTTTDANKKTERGMTEKHPTFDAAKSAIAACAAKAEKLGWTRSTMGRGFAPKPDAFTTLPAPPKKPAATKKVS